MTEISRGPGVLDMKGGLVVIAFAVQALGSPEGQGIIREWIAGAGAALVFEAGRTDPPDAIITRRKGTGMMTARSARLRSAVKEEHGPGRGRSRDRHPLLHVR